MPKITIFNLFDWIAVYADNRRIYNGEPSDLSVANLLELLDIENEEIFIQEAELDDSFVELDGEFPARLEDVDARLRRR